ncbi:hypothetical protein T484DRAFT_1771488 [Baffinella frigidus]|nr:hypothetical protein T484DRAFT_1771488 [Cryptophyta sp. CCMP2293]
MGAGGKAPSRQRCREPGNRGVALFPRVGDSEALIPGTLSGTLPLLLVWCCASTPYAGASNSSNATEFADAGNASNATEYADPSNSSNATLNVHASNASNVTTDASSYADPSNSSNATNCSAAGLPFPTALTVSQTSSVQSADNEIRIEFSFSATISKSTVISITGLRGANTSGPTLAIRPGVGGSLLVEENANWDPESGRVVLHSVRDIRANEGVVAVFTLRNAGSDNSPQTVSVLCANCSSHDRRASFPPSFFSGPLSLTDGLPAKFFQVSLLRHASPGPRSRCSLC